MSAYDADERVARFILKNYREPGEADNTHLRDCPEATVQDADASDGTYGCDTGCSYARFDALITCPHGERESYEWGDFGEVASILEDMEADERAAGESAGR